MRFPEPQTGLVLSYGFLWSDEAARGQSESVKDRPCAVVVALRNDHGTQVTLVPITHSPPGPSQDHVELTPDECRVAGLDGLPHWVVVREVNAFLWPGFDLREIPGRGRCDYGRLPPATMKRVIAAILALRSKGLPMSRTNRD